MGASEATTIIDSNNGLAELSAWSSGNPGGPHTVSISGLTQRNSKRGGIFNPAGTMILDHVTVSGNTGEFRGDGVSGIGNGNGATLTATNVTVNGNATNAAVVSNGSGTFNATNLTVSTNTLLGGSAIANHGSMTLNSPTVSGNADGIGIFTDSGPTTINNGTVTGNKGGVTVTGGNTIAISNTNVANNVGSGGLNLQGGTSITVSGSTVQGNSRPVGGISVGAPNLFVCENTLSITTSRIVNNTGGSTGGGIYLQHHEPTISDTTIAGNSTTATHGGGGLAAFGDGLALDRTTISGNSGGGMHLESGADCGVAQPHVTNVTISGNSGGGLMYTPHADTLLLNSTIANNTGAPGITGIDQCCGNLQLKNTLVANNPAGNCAFGPASRVSLGSNLSSDTTCAAVLTAAGDQNNVNPLLGPLQDNGGPIQTQALQQGSPAINGVTPANCPPPSTDQRGVTRPVGTACDIGAYEFQPATVIAGDINLDGIVDIRDYGVWRTNFGQTNCGNVADLDGNCIVDIRDYGIWRQHFGQVSGATPRSAPGTPPAPAGSPTAVPARASTTR